MSLLTGGYPAEYGRKLGGVIEVVTSVHRDEGFPRQSGGLVWQLQHEDWKRHR